MPLFGGSGILNGGLSGLADDLGKPSEAANAETYNRPFGVGTFDEFGGDVKAGKSVEIARYRVPAGIELRWGFGRAANSRNQGFIWGFLREADESVVDGTISLEWENSTGRRTQVVQEVSTEDIGTTDRTDYDKQFPLPEARDKRKAAQDEFLIVTFTADADATISADDSDVRIPTTEYDVSA